LILSLVFIFAGLFWGNTSNLKPLFSESHTGPVLGGIFAVFVMMPFFFGGFNVIPQVMEEKSPGTSLRLAGKVILLSICAAAAFYLLVILSSSMATPWKRLLTMELPAAGAFEAAFRSGLMARVVLLAGLCGIITTWNTVFVSSSRIIFSLGRGRIIPPVFGKVHPVFGSPYVSVVFVGIIGSLGIFLGRSAIVTIINVSGACFGISFLLICFGVVKLKRSKPFQHRPFRVPGGLPTAVFGVVSSCFILFLALYQPYIRSEGSLPVEWAILLGWGLIGVLFWMLARKIRGTISEEERRILFLGAGSLSAKQTEKPKESRKTDKG
jgi:amino acid transporter